jgi:hypothetical protein
MKKNISRLIIGTLVFVSIFTFSILTSSSKAEAQNADICSLLENLIKAGVEPSALYNLQIKNECITTTSTSSSNLSQKFLEQKLRGPARYAKAAADCKADGMRLPTWEESINANINPSQFLTTYGTTYGKGEDQRTWTSTYCGYEDYNAYATSWRGIPDFARDGRDVNAQYSGNNCTGTSGQRHYYQCVLDDQASIKIISPTAGTTLTSKNLTVSGSCSNYSGAMDVYYYSNRRIDKQIDCVNGAWSTNININSDAASGSFDLYAQAMGDSSAVDKVSLRFNWSTVQSSITVLSPNGGETIINNQLQTIRWSDGSVPNCSPSTCEYGNSNQNVTIYLVDDSIDCSYGFIGCQKNFIIYNGQAAGSYVWDTTKKMGGGSIGPNTVDVRPGTRYKIKVSAGDTMSDMSDNYFRIISSDDGSLYPKLDLMDPKVDGYYVSLNGVAVPVVNKSIDTSWCKKENPTATGSGPFEFSWGDGKSCSWFPGLHTYSATPMQYKISVRVKDTAGLISSRTTSVSVPLENNRPAITVTSPNGGETWEQKSTQTISWRDNTPLPDCLKPNPSGVVCMVERPTYNVSLTKYVEPCTAHGYCPIGLAAPYIITRNVNTNSFNWSVGTVESTGSRSLSVPNGQYRISVCRVDGPCDYSDSYFTIADEGNKPPVISDVTTPTTLKVGETGTWTVKASDPENGRLSYSVSWGDEVKGVTASAASSIESFIQTSTFTHSYSNPGIYSVTFNVQDNTGQLVTFRSTVNVIQPTPVPATSTQVIGPVDTTGACRANGKMVGDYCSAKGFTTFLGRQPATNVCYGGRNYSLTYVLQKNSSGTSCRDNCIAEAVGLCATSSNVDSNNSASIFSAWESLIKLIQTTL